MTSIEKTDPGIPPGENAMTRRSERLDGERPLRADAAAGDSVVREIAAHPDFQTARDIARSLRAQIPERPQEARYAQVDRQDEHIVFALTH